MTRAPEAPLVETIIVPSIHTPIEQLQLQGPPTFKFEYNLYSHTPLPEIYHVYMWASKDDWLPFYCNVGTQYQATARAKYENGLVSIHQQYRDLCGPNFVCILFEPAMNKFHAYSMLHYVYNFYSKLAIPPNKSKMAELAALAQSSNSGAMITMRQPDLDKVYTKYRHVNGLPLPLHSPPGSIVIREGRHEALRKKLLKWITNKEYQEAKKANLPAK